MDVTPKLLREVEFREQRRGYDQKEVDAFLERVAVAFGQVRRQLDEALERAERAERRVLESPADEEELRRTLVLATRTAEAAREEARQSAAATVSEAEDQAAATIRDAQARADSVVGEAEGRVHDELAPLLTQRDAIQRDVEALQAWAADSRRRLTEEVRQQLAWLEGPATELPPAPGLVPVALPEPVGHGDELATVPAEPHGGRDGAEDSGPYGVADGWDPTPPDVRVGERAPDGDATAVFDTLGERTAPGDEDAPGAPERSDDDDPFLAELRRAVDDDEPLGPRDCGAEEPGSVSARVGDADTADDDASSMFRRRKQR